MRHEGHDCIEHYSVFAQRSKHEYGITVIVLQLQHLLNLRKGSHSASRETQCSA